MGLASSLVSLGDGSLESALAREDDPETARYLTAALP